MTGKKTAEVVVIGGGVVGSAVTYFLARNNLDVILLEKGAIASGTSGRCEGDVLVCDKEPGFDCRLAKLSLDLFPQIASELDYDIGWTQKGSLLAIENEEEMEAARKFCMQLAAEGLPVRILDRNEVLEIEPNLAKDIVGGLETGCDGSLYPMGLAYGLLSDAKKRGAQILTHNPVVDIKRDSNGNIQKVIARNGDIITRRVVNAAGVWAPAIGKMVGLNIPIKPRQGQMLVSERTFPVARRKVMEFGYMMAKFGGGSYARRVSPEMEEFGIALVFEPTEAQNFLIGSSRRFVGMDTSCDIRVLRAIAERAIRFFPAIRDINIIRSYAGLRPYTPDHLPIISKTEVPGFYVVAGHEGDGIGLSLITGKLITQMICGEPLDINTDPLRLSRFQEGENVLRKETKPTS
ncbi:MAG: FAD-binding oxidoreductase [Deltaproteobacteria bacterium]|nr:FAD-binding oxidoreductase [Deltaproteobacteria bacterium]MBW1929835.1 FAD-binding oxidoreductase [Deltaproteobacteria bacterium]MBW2024120.1 FAD-binding oxidoreductase [Deltaproteobacteria bacterium]MBW2124379.1 FAD-binding oxidoreductase [Deltaproteobacteria bacterium]